MNEKERADQDITLWLVLEITPMEKTKLEGVYSTEKIADRWVEKLEQSVPLEVRKSEGFYYDTLPVILDEPPDGLTFKRWGK